MSRPHSNRALNAAKTLTRRSFLVGSALIAGGAAFGVYTAKREFENPLEDSFDGALNPFVIIGEETTIVVPRAEMGQGVSTTLAALVAEELDLAWEDIRVIHGPAARAYYNGALIEGGFPVPSWKRTGWLDTVAQGTALLPKAIGLQVTGGSSSTRDAFTRMRIAGAAAREALLQAAAQTEGRDGLTTKDGAVVTADGRVLPYATLATTAAQIDIGEIALRPKSDWRLLGTSLPRTDMVGKVTGTAQYGMDVRLPGMRFATLRQPPQFGATLAALDPAPALAIAGVEAVHRIGDGFAVVAGNSWSAMQGAEALTPEWQAPTSGAGLEMTAVWDTLAAALDGSANLTARDEGDATGTPPEGAVLVEADYRLPYLAHATMEPMSATAWLHDDQIEIWAGVQGPSVAQDAALKAQGVRDAGARFATVHTMFLGGGFGRRIETDYVTPAAELAAKMPGTPVQLMWSREEDMTHDVYRPAAVARARGWAMPIRSDAPVAAAHIQLAAQSVTRAAASRMLGLPLTVGPDHAHLDGIANQPYALSHLRVEGYLAELPVPVGFWRSVGHSIGSFVMESYIDELAHAAGADPLAFRLAQISDPASRAVLEACADRFGWAQAASDGRSGAVKTGRGVAFCHSFGTPVAQMIEVQEVEGSVKITRAVIACDPGVALDPMIIEAQMTGAMVYGLSAAIYGEITLEDGAVIQQNFPDFEAVRMPNCPPFEVVILSSGDTPTGVGEPGTPPAAPALANAIFDLTGQRLRDLPFVQAIDFV
ncbi:molybdopterin cofactor-binding domain-containing protein [Albirhodobacter sp. R86504]|uniref:xanthine dehydrogenase family protein molybdopterin-binding subunit n=1 Tax=Albirhodobacter sp. R86504 TaxID=3093848 RepID=UPI003672CF50